VLEHEVTALPPVPVPNKPAPEKEMLVEKSGLLITAVAGVTAPVDVADKFALNGHDVVKACPKAPETLIKNKKPKIYKLKFVLFFCETDKLLLFFMPIN
jgi:hypothetical protein